jgi:hypothetical protein
VLASRGLAHHNLSPDNVFLVSGDDPVKLLGLGSALFRPREGTSPENARFRAPELASGGPADGRADLFSLALIACHALGATVGFGEAPVVQLPLAVSFELESDEALRQALERSLRSNPAERPTPAELREALRGASGVAVAPPPAEAPADGELLSAVDDEVLNALLSVPAPPPLPAEPAKSTPARVVPFQRGPKVPAPAVEPPAPQGEPAALLRKPAMVGALAGALVLCGLTAFWMLRGARTAAVAAPAVPTAALPQSPVQPAVAKARLMPADFEHLASDLASGLKSGDIAVLRGAVDTVAGQEAGLAPEARADLDRARGAVEAYAQVRAASGQGEQHAQVLERFAALKALLPKASDPDGLRDKAAQALETQADALVGEAKYAEALAKLGPVQKSWPERPGLAERLARYQTWQRSQQEQETLLAALSPLERRKKPWEGLQALQGIEPTPSLAPRFAEVRTRLENLLARLDSQPPQVVLRDGYLLDYARGTVAELSFRATDDYEVRSVKVLGRPEGGKFRELPLEKARAGYYTVRIDPGFHQNGTVDLYAVATDLSGHEGSLGSRDKPLQLKRKQGFERLIR